MRDNSNNSLSISIDNKKTIFASVSINGKLFNNEFIVKEEDDDTKLDKREKDILTVWFNAWKYENERYLAVVPFLRTIKITLDNDKDSKSGKSWDSIRDALENTFRAFTESTNLSLGLGNYGSAQIDLSKFTNVLRADGSTKVNGESVYYHKHATDYLEDSLSKLREKNSNRRIVVFIDDLDRCHPKQALDVLDSIKTFFDIEGIVYVIGMDVDSIDSIIEEKYGGANVKKGSDYLQKIVSSVLIWFQGLSWEEESIKGIQERISITYHTSRQKKLCT
jgi:predicted KAP-like P-loop ATPase